MSTHYDILGVPQNATSDEIKRAYKDSMLANHPDRTQHLPEAERGIREALSKLVNNASECLRDKQSKRVYDMELLKLEQIERLRRREAQQANAVSVELCNGLYPDTGRDRLGAGLD